jgi:hypothetical protein
MNTRRADTRHNSDRTCPWPARPPLGDVPKKMGSALSAPRPAPGNAHTVSDPLAQMPSVLRASRPMPPVLGTSPDMGKPALHSRLPPLPEVSHHRWWTDGSLVFEDTPQSRNSGFLATRSCSPANGGWRGVQIFCMSSPGFRSFEAALHCRTEMRPDLDTPGTSKFGCTYQVSFAGTGPPHWQKSG